MAAINDLIAQIADESLREKLEREVYRLARQKKFGLVFESHLPEVTPLYDIPIKAGCKVMLRNRSENTTIYVAIKVDEETVLCGTNSEEDPVEIPKNNLVRVAEFGEPIYPYLKPIDSICNAPDSALWHMLIEADNYHALQLLEYLYAGKVDCIYIDPPYNTGAKDWKYNNDYVDGNDIYRHSKWLSFIERRLRIAKRLLNPDNSVLIITIDEKEYLHLGCLLEDLFPEAQIQMVSITINPSGAVRKNLFSRADEYAFFVVLGDAKVVQKKGDGEETEARWWYLRRLEKSSTRPSRPFQFYPIYINTETNQIEKIGEPIPHTQDRHSVPEVPGTVAIFPIKDDGTEMIWGVTPGTLRKLLAEHVVQVIKNDKATYQPYSIKYLSENYKKKIEEGRWKITGTREDGTLIVVEAEGKVSRATTVWKDSSYDAKTYGTVLLKNVLGESRFSFPKSLYAVKDSLGYFLAEKRNALVVDFFAGSGTTLQAVNLLNAEDGGQRQCILVTNNEVSVMEAKELADKGYAPGDNEWEKLGVAHNVTWPRTVCSITGNNLKGEPIPGSYQGTDFALSDGFKANAVFFKLGFLNKTAVALGMQFKELLPVIWMKSGAIGKCPELENNNLPSILMLPQNKFAVLIDENCFYEFEQQLSAHPEIQTVFIVTDYEVNYRSMVNGLNVQHTYQLYRDYLDNFRINHGRN